MSEIIVSVTPPSTQLALENTAIKPLLQGANKQVASQVLSIDAKNLVLSMPGQRPLTIDISQQREQVSSLQVGQKLTIELTSDQKNLQISIEKVPPKQPLEGEVALSRDLANKLAQQTSLPSSKAAQIQFIKDNSPVNLGLARRLPGQQINLVTSNQVTIKAALPGSSNIALNQTYQLRLVLNKDNQPVVQFTRLAASSPPIVITDTLKQVQQSSPALVLSKLPITSIEKIAAPVILPAANASSNLLIDELDMSLPKNQLWLRQQPLQELVKELSNQQKAFSQRSGDELTKLATKHNVSPQEPVVSKQHTVAPNKEPSASFNKEPSAASNKEPSASSNKEPSASSNKEPSASSNKEPSASSNKEPSASSN
ncbi:MAG: hypothetical protein HRU25_12375, partial [Psychrobium sp.]|nr:hypothetical protein [Psychrobium sp.]